MAGFQRINITLPKKLVKKSKILIEEGLYSNFSELVKESIKNEILNDINLIEKKRIIDEIFVEELGKGEDTSHLNQEGLIKKIRKTREKLWNEKYKKWFEGLAS